MRFSARLLFSVLALSILFSTTAIGEDDFSVSKNLKFDNDSLKVALNTKTKDVLVVWRQWDHKSNARVYATLLKRLGKGTYKVLKPRLISDKNLDADISIDVAYNPEDNSFVVVWEASEVDSKGSIKTTAAYSLLINSKGKKVGKINTLTDLSTPAYSPVIEYVPSGSVSPTAAKGFYLIAFSAPGLFSYSGEGFYSMRLDHLGKEVPGTVTKLRTSNAKTSIYHAEELILATDQTFALTYTRSKTSGGPRLSFVMRLNPSGAFSRDLELGDGKRPKVLQLSKKMYITTMRNQSKFDMDNQLYRSSYRKAKKSFAPLSVDSSDASDVVKLQDDQGSYQISSASDAIYGRYIKPKGKLGANEESLLLIDNVIIFIEAVCIPGSNELVIVWSETKSYVESEIRAMQYTVTP